MKNTYVSVDGLTRRKPSGRHVDAIRLEEIVNHALETGIASVKLLAFQKLGEYTWQGKLDARLVDAHAQLDRLKPVVEDLLVKAGWEVHIVDSLKKSEAEDYIHSTGGELQVHQVSFSDKWNIELRLHELCNLDGTIRTKGETLAMLKARIGLDAFDLGKLTKDQREHVLAIMEQEELDLENLHDVDAQELTTGAQAFRWFRDDEEAESEAREYLTDDDYMWKEAVAAGTTTDSLEEWAKDAIRIDGWAHILGGYDGLERVAQLKDGTWFQYVRTN